MSDGRIEASTIGHALRLASRECPDREAIVGMGRRLSFAELDRQVDRLAHAFRAMGLKPGDPLAIVMTNCPDWLVTWFAAARAGLVLIPVNTRFKEGEIAYILSQSGARALVMMDTFWGIDFRALIERAADASIDVETGRIRSERLPGLAQVVFWNDSKLPGSLRLDDLKALEDEPLPAEDPDAPVIVVYTSGTTGNPKGAVHSHALLRNADNISRVMRISDGDRIMGHMPFYHIAGIITAVLPALINRGCVLTLEHWEPADAIRLIAQERANIFGGIPTHFIDCIDALQAEPQDTSCLKSAWIGGAPVTPDVALRAREVMQLDALQAVYGMTETMGSTVLSGFDDPLEILCDNKGRPIGDFEVSVVDPETGTARPTDTDGEVWIRGHIVMQGYYKDPKATAEVMTPEGWFRTGDLGRIDKDGYLKITGRVKDMFIVGGANAYPAEIERFLQESDRVKQAIVVGVPDRRLGEVGFAFIIPADTALTEADIVGHCKGRIADYKVPRHVAIVQDLPRTSTGKIQRMVLAQQARETLERRQVG